MDDLCRFRSMLEQATASIPESYFHLPVAEANRPSYRERVYCYELYHQLRCLWPHDSPFSLGGEVDKSGHPLLMKETCLKRLKPDFLVHVPGKMPGNLIVIEVKPIKAKVLQIHKDLTSLNGFVAKANYQLSILLAFGGDQKALASFKRRALIRWHEERGLQPPCVELWWHSKPGVPATIVGW